MMRFRCISCGDFINKSAVEDPYVCRGCENEQGVELGSYAWLE